MIIAKIFLSQTPAQPKVPKKVDRLDLLEQQITQLRKDHQAEIEILRSEVKSLRSELALVNTSASVGTSANNEIIELSEKVQKCSDALFTTVVARNKKAVRQPDSQSVKYLPERELSTVILRLNNMDEEADKIQLLSFHSFPFPNQNEMPSYYANELEFLFYH